MRTYREELLGQVGDHCAQAITGGTCTGITARGVEYRDGQGKTHTLACDTVILAMGMRSKTAEAEAFRDCAPEFRALGDCVKVGNLQKVIRSAYDAAACIGAQFI